MKTVAGALVTAVDAGPGRRHAVVGDVLLSIGSSAVTFKDLSKITARLAPKALVVAPCCGQASSNSVR